MKIEAYLFFDGNAEEALEFYARVLGGQIEGKFRYADSPDPVPPEYMPPGGPDKLLHASLLIDGQRLMLGDGVPRESGGFRGFALTLQYQSEDRARQVFSALADGGQITMPMGPTFFSPCYGMLTDRFGVQWMVMVPSEGQ